LATPSSEQLSRILTTQNESTARINTFKSKISWFRRRLRAWFKAHGRDFPWRDPACGDYELVIAELLLWRTRAENAARLFPKLTRKYPDWEALSQAKTRELRQFLKPLGYVDRAGTLLALARTMRNSQLPSTRDELQALPGVGQYIASALLTICYAQSEPLLDENMARVLRRFFGPGKMTDIRFDPYLQQLSRAILPAAKGVKEFNWAILDLGALICTPRSPKCSICPLQRLCLHAEWNRLPADQLST
jgi:A/G-specific adenine glycosylase